MQRAMKWFLGLLASAALLCGGFVVLHGSLPPASINAWLPAGSLTAARTGAASVLLQDGRLLITGGNGASGVLASTDILTASSGFTAGPPMSLARSSHVAVVLLDGRVLVAGGTDASGRASQSAELFDPAANSWSASGPLMVGRSGATATLLPSGQVLVAGGSANGAALASLELFDPNSNTFSLVAGTLSSLRENHAAALLPDGRVLVAGGWDGTTVAPVPPATTGTPNILASTDIFDPTTGAVGPGPALTSPRMNFTATTALDGSVVAIGGTDGQNDLASIDVLASGGGAFALSGAQLATARQGHQAFLLPHNGNILVVGGTSSGTAVSAVELYTPWIGATSVTGAMASARSGATGSPLFQMVQTAPVGIDGALIVAGGLDASSPPATLQSAEVYGFTWIKTDAADYSPGTTVYVSGGGWQPGETLNITLVESPFFDTHGPYTVTVGPDGTFTGQTMNSQDTSCATDGTPCTFAPDIHDVNVQFALTAVGSATQSQTTFTDSVNFSLGVAVLGAQAPNPVLAGNSAQYGADAAHSVAVTFTAGGSGSVSACTAGLTVSAGLPSGATASFSPSSLTTSGSSTQTLNSLLTVSTLSTTPAGTYTITVKADKASGCTGSAATTTTTLVVVAPQLVFTNAPFNALAGQCSAVTVQRQDSNGTPTTSGSQGVSLSTSSGVGSFFSDNSCNTATPSTTIANGNSSSTLYYKDNADGTPTLTASASGFTSGTQGEAINLQLAFTSSAFTVNTGVCSPLITLRSQNYAATLTAPIANRVLSLSSSSGGGTFYGNSICTTPITTANLPHNGAGAGTASFYYEDTTAGSPMISVSGTLLVSAMQTETVNAANVATTLTLDAPSPASVSLGSSGPVTFTAHLKRNDTNAAVSGATIHFTVDGTDVGATATTDGTGTATLSTYNPSALTGGSHNVAASFTAATISGTSYSGSTSTSTPQTLIVTVPTTLTLSAPSPASVSLGSAGPVTLSATLTRTSGGTGVSGATITFKVDGSSVGTTNTNASGIASITTYNPSSLSASSHTVLASFAGATISSITYEAKDSNTETLTMVAPPTISKAFLPTSVAVNSPSTITFTLTNPNSGVDLTGVAFTDTFPTNLVVASPTGAGSTCPAGTFSPSTGAGSVSFSAGTITKGTNCTVSVNVTSATGGTYDNTTGAISSTNGGTGVASNTATLTVVAPPTISKAFSPTSIAVGAPTTLTFTLTNPNSFADLTGVAFSDTFTTNVVVASPTGAGSTCPAGTFSPSAGAGSVSFSGGTITKGTSCTVSVNVTSFSVGTGSYNNTTGAITSTNGGTGTVSNTATLTVTPATTSTGVSSSQNSSIYGTPVTFTATVTNTSSGSTATPTGSISFSIDGGPAIAGTPAACSGTPPPYTLCATYTTSTIQVNGSPHSVAATYTNSDGNFVGSNGALSPGQTVTPAATSTQVLSSANPSVFQQNVTFTALVTNASTGSTAKPTAGTVTFTIDGNPFTGTIGICPSAVPLYRLCATYSTSTLGVGNHPVSASYVNSDGNFNGSSGSLTGGQVVNKAATTTVVLSSVGGGSPSAPNSSTLNQSVTFTATVTVNPPGSGSPIAPSGTVTFTYTNAALALSGTLGTAPLTSGQATLSTSALPVNANVVTATYNGDGNFVTSNGNMTQTVQYSTAACDGDLGHSILQPINADGSSVFKQTSTVPAKFRVCDFNGNSVGTPGVVSSFKLVQVVSGTIVNTVDEAVDSTTPDTMFRWDTTGQQWIFNISTKYAPVNVKNQTYSFTISLNDSSTIMFIFGLK